MPLFRLFSVFSNKQYNFTTNICEKNPSSIWCQDSNPQPSERESLPITTRPGLPRGQLFPIDLMLLKKRSIGF